MAIPEKLKLRARDSEDLQVLSACLQDAILPISDMNYDRAARRFVVVANRFCWERVSDVAYEAGSDGFERVNCGVVFEGVAGVKLRHIDRADRSLLLSLLAIRAAAQPKGCAIMLVCSGERDIRLEVDQISVQLEDFDGHWPTANRPNHRLDDAE
jgi:hypothetical protein